VTVQGLAGSRTRSASTSSMYVDPTVVVYVTDARHGLSGVHRTQRDCQPGHQRPSRFTSTARRGSKTRRVVSSAGSVTATTVGIRGPR